MRLFLNPRFMRADAEKKSLGFTLRSIVLTLALGIGANHARSLAL